jgi:predicted DCC family thiol-disulfide oxidoreductase YuxK
MVRQSKVMTLLYDGNCPFCVRGALSLQRRFGATRLELRDFQDPHVIERYLARTPNEMNEMRLIMHDGSVYAGCEAFAKLFSTFRGLRWIAFVYWMPGLRQIVDAIYRLGARNRYRLFGRQCETGKCAHSLSRQ